MGCGPSRKQKADDKILEISILKEKGNYNVARIKIDSFINDFPDQLEQVNIARRFLNEISKLEQERNLLYLDSMLSAKEALLAPMMKNFLLSDDYGAEKVLIHKRQIPENNYNRTFLRANLNEKGDFYISSRYFGDKWIYHNQIKVYNQSQSVLSDVVPEDGFDNRRFDDMAAKWEIVKFKYGKDNGIIDYIATHWQEPLKVQFIGKGHTYIVMEKHDKEAIRDGYEISFVLKEIRKIKEEKKKVEKTLKETL